MAYNGQNDNITQGQEARNVFCPFTVFTFKVVYLVLTSLPTNHIGKPYTNKHIGESDLYSRY